MKSEIEVLSQEGDGMVKKKVWSLFPKYRGAVLSKGAEGGSSSGDDEAKKIEPRYGKSLFGAANEKAGRSLRNCTIFGEPRREKNVPTEKRSFEAAKENAKRWLGSCSYCKEKHRERDCPIRKDSYEATKSRLVETKPRKCFFCDESHREKDCPTRAELLAIVKTIEKYEAKCRDREERQVEKACARNSVEHVVEPQRLGALHGCQKAEAEGAPWENSISSSIEKSEQRHRQEETDGIESGISIKEENNHGEKDPVVTLKEEREKCSPLNCQIWSSREGRHTHSNEGVARSSGGECHGPWVSCSIQPSTKVIEIPPSVVRVAQGRVNTSPGVDRGPLGHTLANRGVVAMKNRGSRNESVNIGTGTNKGGSKYLVARKDLKRSWYEAAPSSGLWNDPESRWTDSSYFQRGSWPDRQLARQAAGRTRQVARQAAGEPGRSQGKLRGKQLARQAARQAGSWQH